MAACPSWDLTLDALRLARRLLAAAGAPPAGEPPGARLKRALARIGAAEARAEVRRRVGQELYRGALLELWGGRCAVTGLAVPALLRASHAKPWAAATDAERLDPYNGLPLAVQLDALFDAGLLTFGEAGEEGVLSAALPAEARLVLGVREGALRLRWVDARHQGYLAWHRTHVFERGEAPHG